MPDVDILAVWKQQRTVFPFLHITRNTFGNEHLVVIAHLYPQYVTPWALPTRQEMLGLKPQPMGRLIYTLARSLVCIYMGYQILVSYRKEFGCGWGFAYPTMHVSVMFW